MEGAFIGDIVGSKYEWRNFKHKDFPLFSEGCRATDDSLMTLAVARAFAAVKAQGKLLERPYGPAAFGQGNAGLDAGFGGFSFTVEGIRIPTRGAATCQLRTPGPW